MGYTFLQQFYNDFKNKILTQIILITIPIWMRWMKKPRLWNKL